VTAAAAIAPRSPARGRRRVPPVCIAGAVVGLVVLVRAIAAEPFSVPTESMAPTLLAGDHVLVDKLAYRFSAPRRDDLVVFHSPSDGEILLKRVVALGGDRVGIEDGVLLVNGRARREPYVDLERFDTAYFGPVRVPAGSVFLLGDRRLLILGAVLNPLVLLAYTVAAIKGHAAVDGLSLTSKAAQIGLEAALLWLVLRPAEPAVELG